MPTVKKDSLILLVVAGERSPLMCRNESAGTFYFLSVSGAGRECRSLVVRVALCCYTTPIDAP